MSGKNLDQPWHFLPLDGYTRSGWFEWSIQLLAVFSSLVHWINLILHILIILNVLNNFSTIWHMLDHSKVTKNAFLNDPKCQKKRFLAIIRSLVCWIDLILHIVIVLNVFNIRQCFQVMKDHSNITEMHFWMIHRAKNEVFRHFLEFGTSDGLRKAYKPKRWND